MSKKHSSLLSTLLIVSAIILVVNYLVGGLNFLNLRFDMTQKHLYTLSDGTRHILSGIPAEKAPVTLRYYASQDGRVMPQVLDGYARTVQDLLMEFEKASNGKVILEKIDPRPDSETEDKAREDDVLGQVGNNKGDKFYLGLAISCLDKKEVIPFLNPGTETALEYDVARAIAKVTNPKKPSIGVMSPMPIAGPAMSEQLMQMMHQQQPQPWAVFEMMRYDYNVRTVPFTAEHIDDDINILIVVHPADIQERTEFALDQFVLRGGKLIAFVDPQSAISARYNNQGNPMMGQQPTFVGPNSTLKTLFKTWGIGYDSGLTVADMTLRSAPPMDPDTAPNPFLLAIGPNGINRDEPFAAPLERVQMFTPGAFTVDKKEGITSTTLLQSSEKSMLVDSTSIEKLQRERFNNFQPSGKRQILGLRLTGHFKTAFPDGPPAAKPPGQNGPALPGGFPGGFPGGPPPGDKGGAPEDAGSPKAAAPTSKDAPATEPKPAETPKSAAEAPKPAPAAKPPVTVTTPPVTVTTPPVSAQPAPAKAPAPAPATPAAGAKAPAPPAPAVAKKDAPAKPTSLKESVNNDGVVFLFADADMLIDGLCALKDRAGGFAWLNHNGPLLMNIIDLLNGGSDLINVRSRGATKRGFAKLQELRDDVEKEYRPAIQKLEEQRADALKQISSLKVTTDKEGNQVIILDPEKKQQLMRLQDNEKDFSKQLREIKKKQNSKVDSLENWITGFNLLAVPLLVILFGIALAYNRRSQQAAR